MRLIPLLVALALSERSFAQPDGSRSIPQGTSAISGVLIDARTKQPIAGCNVALIQVNAPRNALTTTDVTGAYAFTGIADGEYHLNTLCDSHRSNVTDSGVALTADTEAKVIITLGRR